MRKKILGDWEPSSFGDLVYEHEITIKQTEACKHIHTNEQRHTLAQAQI